MKKFFKKVLFVLLVMGVYLSLGLAVRAASPGGIVGVPIYASIEDIPTVLPDVSDICFCAKHSVYQKMPNARNLLLGQVVTSDGNILVTFSVPKLEGIETLDVEEYDFLLKECPDKNILMVTVEYSNHKNGEVIAESYLYVFNPEENPAVGFHYEDGVFSVHMDKIVAMAHFSSKEATMPKLWTDDYTQRITRTNIYKSFSAGMSNFNYEGWSYDVVDDVFYDYGYVNLPYDMRKYLMEYMFDYNEYVSHLAEKENWYKTLKAFWKGKSYDEFDLDRYAESLGATVQNPPTSNGEKEYVLGDHIVRVGCFLCQTDVDETTAQRASIGLDCSYVEWDASGAKTSKNSYDFNTHCFKVRDSEELVPVKVDQDGYFVSRWDFDFVVSLLGYCAKTM